VNTSNPQITAKTTKKKNPLPQKVLGKPNRKAAQRTVSPHKGGDVWLKKNAWPGGKKGTTKGDLKDLT